jgi:hypothetical protein
MTDLTMNAAKVDALWATINRLYDQWDEGLISDEDAVEKAALACETFLGMGEKSVAMVPRLERLETLVAHLMPPPLGGLGGAASAEIREAYTLSTTLRNEVQARRKAEK